MLVLPVLDLRHGQIVHARCGKRSTYQPVCSPLSRSSVPAEVLGAFLDLYPFPAVYLADLDAILDQRPQLAAVEALRRRSETVELWVDAGIATEEDWDAWRQFGRVRPVIGSEGLPTLPAAQAVLAGLAPCGPVLSLDFAHGALLGPAPLATATGTWPKRIILMGLDRVGSHDGPDTARLTQARSLAPGRQFFSAGGVRNAADLRRLQSAGASGALVASALHDGGITHADLEGLSTSPHEPTIPSA